LRRLRILNIWVDDISKEECLEKVVEFVEENDPGLHTIFASNPEKNFSVPKHAEIYHAYKNADILLPDGVGVVFAARVLYGAKIQRLPGVDVFGWLCSLAAERGYRVFVFGSKEDVNKKAVAALNRKYPGLKIAGRSHGYIAEGDMPSLVKKINESRAQILFVGLGSPKQERWIASYGHLLETVRVCQGIGGTLDTIAGSVKRAPVAWQRAHLEWLYRVLKEPKRIKRQVVLPLFVVNILAERLRRARFGN